MKETEDDILNPFGKGPIKKLFEAPAPILKTEEQQMAGLKSLQETAQKLTKEVFENSREGKMLNFEKAMTGADGGIGGSGIGWGAVAQAGTQVLNAVDQMTMGDKNFGAQSAAIDSAVHGASLALMSSGNPYAMAAGAGLEVANYMTKMGGQTTEGFDVNINNSGFGQLAHKDSSSSIDFGAMIGLGGLNSSKMDRKLARRNEEAQLAMKAANISDTILFEQEARMNSVQDVMEKNRIALSGGIDTQLLAAKRGGILSNNIKQLKDEKGHIIEIIPARLTKNQKAGRSPIIYKGRKYFLNGDGKTCLSEMFVLKRDKNKKISNYATGGLLIVEDPCPKFNIIEDNTPKIITALNGAKLLQVLISDDPNVIPSGALHKNKHQDFELDNITKKGIPVITIENDNVTTLEEIQQQEESVVLHAEVEKEEIIFNKELTEFIEDLRSKWHESNEQDDNILLEAGMRLAKELIENTEDNTNVTEKAQTQI